MCANWKIMLKDKVKKQNKKQNTKIMSFARVSWRVQTILSSIVIRTGHIVVLWLAKNVIALAEC